MQETISPIYILLEAKGGKAFILGWVQRVCFIKNKAKHVNVQASSKSRQHQEYIWKKRSRSGLSVWQVPLEKSVIYQQIRTCTVGPTAVKGLHSISRAEPLLALLGRKADIGMQRWNILQRWFFYIILNLLSIKFYRHILDHPKAVAINPEISPVLYMITLKCSFIVIYFILLNIATWSVFVKYMCSLRYTCNLKACFSCYSRAPDINSLFQEFNA